MKRALVTGANRGIGYEIAKGLAKQGFDVLLGARDAGAGEAAAAELGVTALHLDVGDLQSIERALQTAGDIDVLVNNAGVLGTGGVLDDPADFDRSMSIMVAGPYHLMRLLTPGMAQRGYGRVVTLSSGWGALSVRKEGPGA